ncbi:MAG: indolepyruvate ferredoxin oxidoreductase subunit alpha [Bacteriovoracia bacterium]
MSAHRITKACTECEDCVAMCPTQSIFYGAERFVIDLDTCTGCRVCVQVCPVNAIVPADATAPAVSDGKKS